tara:strand:- start:4045 stop:4242 length:198 start_codon:yes stop_codon:yes gene_type:complete
MSLIKQHLYNKMIDNLEMLTAREQLMEDIDSIVEEHSYYSNMSAEKAEDLIRVLCDAVCKNFPTK